MSLSIPGDRHIFVADRCFLGKPGNRIRLTLRAMLAASAGWKPDRQALYLDVHGRVNQGEKVMARSIHREDRRDLALSMGTDTR
ncbi:hypothetical protein KSF_111490 [Reticulibacter mediterranei]|uniref:Uncharacterized protein n=1 Tax=Reticulibacter mediterranei TaxID=2778369 RepID=A0A8J3J3X2_9CHLR|nr:hypothetical protein KSF_111490 [Reticulibacter mediterranei]